MILPQSFYNQKTLKVAQNLLGCFLVRRFADDRILKYKIVETEAYNGPKDLASHASRGKTSRNEVMFGSPGLIYVYFTYGMHYMFNVVTEKENYPAAVLIRAVEEIVHPQPLQRRDFLVTNGPAKLTKTLKIDKCFNRLPIFTKKYGLWVENRTENIKPSQIKKTTRVGVDYAKNYKDKLWRFYLKNSKFVSRQCH